MFLCFPSVHMTADLSHPWECNISKTPGKTLNLTETSTWMFRFWESKATVGVVMAENTARLYDKMLCSAKTLTLPLLNTIPRGKVVTIFHICQVLNCLNLLWVPTWKLDAL